MGIGALWSWYANAYHIFGAGPGLGNIDRDLAPFILCSCVWKNMGKMENFGNAPPHYPQVTASLNTICY